MEPMNVGLPKWPQMLVRGAQVEVEQALEIIRRTDSFFSYGNLAGSAANHGFYERVADLLGMPSGDPYDRGNRYWEKLQSWQESWGLIQTDYVRNDWIASSFIFGAHGWCSPAGKISFIDNVGKWPSIEDLHRDWTVLATAFPFLRLDALFMNGEAVEEGIRPAVGLVVRNGRVEAKHPHEHDWFAEFGGYPEVRTREVTRETLAPILDGHRQTLAWWVFELWAAQQKNETPQLSFE